MVQWRREFQISNFKFQIVLSLYYWANLRIWSKIRVFLGWSKFVSAYVERDKKILKNFIFAFAPLRIWSIFRRSRFLVRE